MSHLYLAKSNDDLVSHCHCRKSDALITSPGQADCPWCGCGWLFMCGRCGKAFTFADATDVNETWEETGDRAIRFSYKREPTPGEVEEWVDLMKLLLERVQPGQQYVYLDGHVIPTTATQVRLLGWHSQHDLDFVPQVAALDDPEIRTHLLSSKGYWLSTAIEED